MDSKTVNQTVNKFVADAFGQTVTEYTKHIVETLAKEWGVSDEQLSEVDFVGLVKSFKVVKISNGKKSKKSKKVPGEPSKAKTAYILFSTDIRPSLINDEEGNKREFSDIGKLIGEKWKSLSDKEKKVYEKRAEEDKERYEKEMKQFDPNYKVKTVSKKPELTTQEKNVQGVESAKTKSKGDDIFCYNISTGRSLKYNKKAKDDSKYWDTSFHVCGNTEEVKNFITDAGWEGASKKKVKAGGKK
jgi:hypothetical protein